MLYFSINVMTFLYVDSFSRTLFLKCWLLVRYDSSVYLPSFAFYSITCAIIVRYVKYTSIPMVTLKFNGVLDNINNLLTQVYMSFHVSYN